MKANLSAFPAYAADVVLAYTKAVDAYYEAYNKANKKVTESNYAELQKLLDDVKAAQDKLTSKDIEKLPVKYLKNGNPFGLELDVTTQQAPLTTKKDDAEARADLNKAIKEANALVDSVTESVDGKNVAKDKMWATNADITTFKNAIKAAKTVADDDSKVKSDLDGAKATLAGARSTFAPQLGTKAN